MLHGSKTEKDVSVCLRTFLSIKYDSTMTDVIRVNGG